MKVLQLAASDRPAVISLCDYSGRWASGYLEMGYTVVLVDTKHGDDVNDPTLEAQLEQALAGRRLRGILAAPPCTHFTGSGAQYWAAKDRDGRTAAGVAIVRGCLRIIKYFRARYRDLWWAMENPVGRLPLLVPELGQPLYYFDPIDYAGWSPTPEEECYTKRTGIWGLSRRPQPRPHVVAGAPPGGLGFLEPLAEAVRTCSQGSWVQSLGGKSERTKELRSMTPLGFGRAFAAANP